MMERRHVDQNVARLCRKGFQRDYCVCTLRYPGGTGRCQRASVDPPYAASRRKNSANARSYPPHDVDRLVGRVKPGATFSLTSSLPPQSSGMAAWTAEMGLSFGQGCDGSYFAGSEFQVSWYIFQVSRFTQTTTYSFAAAAGTGCECSEPTAPHPQRTAMQSAVR